MKSRLATFMAIPHGKRVARDPQRKRAGHLGYLARRRRGKTNQMTEAIRSRAWVTRNLWMDIWDDKFREQYPDWCRVITTEGARAGTKEFVMGHEDLFADALKQRLTSTHRIARLLGVSQSSVRRWLHA
jgi:hypothetical protein